MLRFGYYFLNGKLVVYDVTLEYTQGHRHFVATLSENPKIRFTAVRPETAVQRLKDFMEFGNELPTLAGVTWMPKRVNATSRKTS